MSELLEFTKWLTEKHVGECVSRATEGTDPIEDLVEQLGLANTGLSKAYLRNLEELESLKAQVVAVDVLGPEHLAEQRGAMAEEIGELRKELDEANRLLRAKTKEAYNLAIEKSNLRKELDAEIKANTHQGHLTEEARRELASVAQERDDYASRLRDTNEAQIQMNRRESELIKQLDSVRSVCNDQQAVMTDAVRRIQDYLNRDYTAASPLPLLRNLVADLGGVLPEEAP